MMEYDERTLRKVKELLTSESGRTESYEATYDWVVEQLGKTVPKRLDVPKVPARWDTYDESH
jgi:hypothetical protein